MKIVKFHRTWRIFIVVWTVLLCGSMLHNPALVYNIWFLASIATMFIFFEFLSRNLKNFDFVDSVDVKPRMTPEKILEVVAICKKAIKDYPDLNFEDSGEEFPIDKIGPNRSQDLGHCEWMLDQIEKQIKENDFEIGRINRWLGFVQHSLWVNKIYSLENMMDHNRPSK